jgi:hypothetical protein
MARSDDISSPIAKYSPEIASQLRSARKCLSGYFPQGFELVYDNYNALAIGYSPSDRAGQVVVSVAAYPKWVTLFFLNGKGLKDPEKLLQGAGSRVRSIRLSPPTLLKSPAVDQLIRAAIAPAADAFAQAPKRTTILKSVSAKQRPRRPVEARAAKRKAKKS